MITRPAYVSAARAASGAPRRALEHLHAQYVVPAFAGPIVIAAHIMTVTTLIETR